RPVGGAIACECYECTVGRPRGLSVEHVAKSQLAVIASSEVDGPKVGVLFDVAFSVTSVRDPAHDAFVSDRSRGSWGRLVIVSGSIRPHKRNHFAVWRPAMPGRSAPVARSLDSLTAIDADCPHLGQRLVLPVLR